MTDHFSSPVDPERHRALSGESRVRVLEVLRADGTRLGIAEIASRVGLHPNTVRLHLDQLVDAGLVIRDRESRNRPGRPRLVYASDLAGDPGTSSARVETEESRYEMLAEALVTHLERTALEPAAEAVAAGRAWGRDLARQDAATAPTVQQATADLAQLLDDVGFAPRTTGPGQTIELHRCPFRQLAGEHSPVVCGVHLGLMQGALAERAAPMQASGLEPFVTPELCLAHFDTEEPSKS